MTRTGGNTRMGSILPEMRELLQALPEPHRLIEVEGTQKLENGTTVNRSYFFHISNQVAEVMPVPMLSKWTTGMPTLIWNLPFFPSIAFAQIHGANFHCQFGA